MQRRPPGALWSDDADAILYGRPGANLGTHVGDPGDVSGDGYADVGVGSWDFSETFVLPGPLPTGAEPSADPVDATLVGDGRLSVLPSVVPGADRNADGYNDLFLSCRGPVEGGGVVVVDGQMSGVLSVPGASATFWHEDNVGVGVSLATGDVEDEGVLDVLLGAEGLDHGAEDAGGAFLLRTDAF